MSPLEIHCLLELYALADPGKDGKFQSTLALKGLVSAGLARNTSITVKCAGKITEKGREHVQSMCDLPFPLRAWVRPYKIKPTVHELEQILKEPPS